MKSYVNVQLPGWKRVRELAALYEFRRAGQAEEASGLVQGVREHTLHIEALLGEALRGKRLLEVGPGQLLKRARIFGVDNDVTGIDLDEIPGSGLGGMLDMWRANGPLRAFKTLARRALGMDRHFLDSLHEILPAARDADVRFLRRDATDTGFADGHYDVTLSNSVLEHIPDPEALVREMIRVTRPGGVFSHIVHLYTSDTGAHDPRSFVQDHSSLPYWCHLRPSQQHLSAPNCYLNEWSMQQWLELTEKLLPGAVVERLPDAPNPALAAELARLRKQGELADYSDAELLTDCLIISWRKP